MSKKSEYVRLKNYERKIKLPSIFYADFESILMESKIQVSLIVANIKNMLLLVIGYKLVCVDDKFSKPFKSSLDEDAIYNFMNSIIKESKYCTNIMQKYFNKALAMTKKHDEDFENATKCLICDNFYVDGDVKVRDH